MVTKQIETDLSVTGKITQTGAPVVSEDVVTKLYADTEDDADYARIGSKGGQLVVNGTGLLQSNYNFSAATFVASDRPAGSAGSFLFAVPANTILFSDEFIPIDIYKYYVMSVFARETMPGAPAPTFSSGIACYDLNNSLITQVNVMHFPNTLTTLAAALNPGNTTVTLTSAANWADVGSTNVQRTFIFWNWVDVTGYTWPSQTFSKWSQGFTGGGIPLDAWAIGGISGNVITLRNPWAGPAFPAGHPLSNGIAGGGSYQYGGWNNTLTTTSWVQRDNKTTPFGGGIHLNPLVPSTLLFPYGASKIKLVLVGNRGGSSRTAVAGVSFEEYGHSHPELYTAKWINATLAANVTNYGGEWQTVQYRLVGDKVELRGRPACAVGSPLTLFTLPVGYRPPASLIFNVLMNDALARVAIRSTGVVSVESTSAAGYVDLNGIQFSINIT